MRDLMELFVGVPRYHVNNSMSYLEKYIKLLIAGDYVDDIADARGIVKNLQFRMKRKSDIISIPLSTLMQTINHLTIYRSLLHACEDVSENDVQKLIDFLIDCEQAAISLFKKERDDGSR